MNNENVKVEHRYVAFWKRCLATFIDMIVFAPVIALIMYNLGSLKSIYIMFLSYIPHLLYKPIMESKYGGTLGKLACKIKVTDIDGEFVSFKTSFIRFRERANNNDSWFSYW